ncbi:hypothetical protein WR25_07792 [Diploscapter pachys]|uniref:Uncharacterized protein n=1 Tax=Diploscapter pachys TaxID=2018661 RepID=A0A2A2JPN7_9BILA|nr:hypothetical protein WR25_07792 [Diploscapter pachys]
MDRSRMPDFYHSQNKEIKMIIAATFEKSTDLEEFARAMMSIKPVLNNPDAFDKWMENEEIEFEQKEQQKENALRLPECNKEHIQNLEDICNEKTNEYKTIQKRCSDVKAMGQKLEINFHKNRTKAMNFVNELADYCHLNEDAGSRLDQHVQFSSYCTLEDMQPPCDMYGDATYTEDKEKKLENYNLSDAQRDSNDIAMEDKHDSEPASSSQAGNSAECEAINDIDSCPSEGKNTKKKSCRMRTAKRTPTNVHRLNAGKMRKTLSPNSRHRSRRNVYNEKLKKAQDCILPLCDWVHYLLGSLTQQIHAARRDQIIIDIEEIRQTFDVNPCTSTLM